MTDVALGLAISDDQRMVSHVIVLVVAAVLAAAAASVAAASHREPEVVPAVVRTSRNRRAR
jgi:hypothetical protein